METVTYYDLPVLKKSVWGIDIPLYYFVGGAAGAAMTLGAAIQLVCTNCPATRELRDLSKRCHWIGIVGSTAGAALLIHDLGRPERFLNMMRVFRPTSPMNMGAWILGGAAPAAITTGLLINRQGLAGVAGEAAGYVSGVFGAGLAGYTGVLVANSAIPLWQDARRWMPVLFVGSAMSTAAGVIELFHQKRRAERVVHLFGTVGRVAELAAAEMVVRACRVPRVSAPLRNGTTGLLWKAASVLTAASLLLSLWPRRSRGLARFTGGLAAAGSLSLRFAVHYASQVSASDARATFEHQRQPQVTS